jgi:hypothetical protein
MATLQTQPLAAAAPADLGPPTADALRAEINRRNSLHSTGPTSSEGKEAVRLNAVKTGIYAKTIVLPGEDRAAYDAIGARLAAAHSPQTPQEKHIVQSIQDTEWRIDRVIGIETNLHLVVGMRQLAAVQNDFGPLEPLENLALAQVAGYLAHARTFNQLNRREAQLRRLREDLLRELVSLVAGRPAPQPAAAQPNGFVSSMPPPTPAAPEIPRHILDRMPNFVGETAAKHQAEWLKKHAPHNAALPHEKL